MGRSPLEALHHRSFPMCNHNAEPRRNAPKQQMLIALGIVVILAAAAVNAYQLRLLTVAGYLCTCLDVWDYHESPWFLSYMQRQWSSWQELEAAPIPELKAEDFTRETFWRLTDNLRKPVVIRGALQNTTAVNEWGQQFFVENYPEDLIVTRHTIGVNDFRVVRVPMKDFWAAFDQGLNVTIFTSSSIFEKRPELRQQMAAPFEADFVDKSGNGIFASQMFVTPGGRTFLHSEGGGNMFRQLSGNKRWMMIAPQHRHYLCPFMFRGYATIKTCVQNMPDAVKEQWFTRVPRMETILQPGDVVFTPPWHWHDAVSVRSNTRQASVAGRMHLHKQAIANGPLEFFGMVADVLLAKVMGVALTYPTNNYDTELEDFIVMSWRDNCIAAGRSDCHGLPIEATKQPQASNI